MSSAFPLHRYTYQEYVWLEAESTIRHEYLAGEIVAMAEGTPEHAAMAAELIEQSHWSLAEAGAGARIALEKLGCTLDVDAVYRAAAEPAEPHVR